MEVNLAFSRIEEGYENGLKDYFKKAVGQLNALIEILLTDISPLERQKIETICTIDVHARDVVAKMVQAKVNLILFSTIEILSFNDTMFRLKVPMNSYGNVNYDIDGMKKKKIALPISAMHNSDMLMNISAINHVWSLHR